MDAEDHYNYILLSYGLLSPRVTGMSGEDNSTELAMMATEKSRDVYRFRDFTLLIQRMVGMAKVVCYGRLVYVSVCFPFCPWLCVFSCNFLFSAGVSSPSL